MFFVAMRVNMNRAMAAILGRHTAFTEVY
jgi:hypothetical protein